MKEHNEVVESLDMGQLDGDPNLEESFIDDDIETMAYEQAEADLDIYFYRHQRISCFAHDMMLAVKTVRKFILFILL